jgi:hypothetical protein
MPNLKLNYCNATTRFSRISAMVDTLFPVSRIHIISLYYHTSNETGRRPRRRLKMELMQTEERRKERKKERKTKEASVSVEWATDHEAKDIGSNKLTSPRAGTHTPMRDKDNDDDAEFFDAEEGRYVQLPLYPHVCGLYLRNLKLTYFTTLRKDSRKFLSWSWPLHYYFAPFHNAWKRQNKGKKLKETGPLRRGTMITSDKRLSIHSSSRNQVLYSS